MELGTEIVRLCTVGMVMEGAGQWQCRRSAGAAMASIRTSTSQAPSRALAPEKRLWQVSLVLGVYVYMCVCGCVGMFLAFCMVPL